MKAVAAILGALVTGLLFRLLCGAEPEAPAPRVARSPGPDPQVEAPSLAPPVAAVDFPVGDRAPAGAPPEDLLLEPTPTVRIQARVVDLQGTPVADLPVLAVQRDRRPQELLTDAAGRFAVEALSASRIQVFARAGTSPASPTRPLGHLDPAASEMATLALAIGPRYALRLDLPAGVRAPDLVARLLPPGKETPFPETAVQGSADPWVRFLSPGDAMFDPAEPWHLEVATRDQRYLGRAPVQQLSGVQQEPVHLHLERVARVRGRVLDARGLPVSGARVQFLLEGKSAVETTTRGDGAFSFGIAHSGAALLRALPPATELELAPAAVDVWIAADGDLVQDVTLATLSGTEISGRLSSRSGRESFRSQTVELRALDGSGLSLVALVTPREEGSTRFAEFLFPRVPPGDYELRARGSPFAMWSPPVLSVAPPATSLEFVLEDEVALTDLTFTASDATTSASLPSFWLRLTDLHGREHVLAGTADQPARLRLYPEGQPLRWSLGAPGYAPHSGDESVLLETSEDPEGVLEVAVALQREEERR